MFHTTAGGCDSDEGLEIHFTVPCSTKQKDRLVNSLARHLAHKVNKERDLLKYRCSMCIARKGMRKQAAKQVTKKSVVDVQRHETRGEPNTLHRSSVDAGISSLVSRE